MLRQQHPLQPLWLWGLRAGCLLAAEAACQLDAPCNLLFWQPAPTGKVVLQQFLRLKVAGDMLDGSVKGAANTLRAQLVANETVEIAGYRLSPALATGLERATLAPPPLASTSGSCRAVLLEISAREGANPSPVAATNAEAWRRAGYEVTTAFAVGPAFWQTSEIEEVPAMIDATLAAVAETADA